MPVEVQAARIPLNRSSCCCCCACGDVVKARSGLSIISIGVSPQYASAGVRPPSAECGLMVLYTERLPWILLALFHLGCRQGLPTVSGPGPISGPEATAGYGCLTVRLCAAELGAHARAPGKTSQVQTERALAFAFAGLRRLRGLR